MIHNGVKITNKAAITIIVVKKVRLNRKSTSYLNKFMDELYLLRRNLRIEASVFQILKTIHQLWVNSLILILSNREYHPDNNKALRVWDIQ